MKERTGANQKKKSEERKHNQKKAVTGSAKTLFSFIRKSIAMVLVAGALGYGGYSVQVWLRTSPAFIVHSTDIDTTKHVGRSEVVAALGCNAATRIFDVKPVLVRARMGKNVWIKDVIIEKRYPDKIVVKVTERTPIALVNMGTLFLVDIDGMVLPMSRDAAGDLPVISGVCADSTGVNGSKILVATDRFAVADFFAQAKIADPAFMTTVSQIDFSDKKKVTLMLKAYPTIITLDRQRSGEKIIQLNRLLAVVDDSTGVMPSHIDLSYTNLAYVQ